MSLKRVTHSACSHAENTKLTNAMKSSPKCRWVVSIELDENESVTFEAYSGKTLTVAAAKNWPPGLVVTPASGSGSSVTIAASGVPSSNKGRNYWYEIFDDNGNKIDPIIIPR